MNDTELIKTLESYGFYIQNTHVKHEEVNELKELQMQKIFSQSSAIDAVKYSRIVIGSFDAKGNFSVAKFPTLHLTDTAARAECKRLSQITPGKLFTFMTLCGGELVPLTSNISI